MKLTLHGNATATPRSRRVDLVGHYGYSDAAKAHEPISGADIRRAYPVRFDASFLRRIDKGDSGD
jgi:hypothetical protein